MADAEPILGLASQLGPVVHLSPNFAPSFGGIDKTGAAGVGQRDKIFEGNFRIVLISEPLDDSKPFLDVILLDHQIGEIPLQVAVIGYGGEAILDMSNGFGEIAAAAVDLRQAEI